MDDSELDDYLDSLSPSERRQELDRIFGQRRTAFLKALIEGLVLGIPIALVGLVLVSSIAWFPLGVAVLILSGVPLAVGIHKEIRRMYES